MYRSLIIIGMIGTVVTAWQENSYLRMTEKIGQTLNRSCWICTALPRGEGRVPVYGIVVLNWTIPEWVEHGKCKFGIEDKPQKGPKFDLLVINSSRSIFVDRKVNGKDGVGVGWRNLTGLGCSWEYGNFRAISEVSEAGRWNQGEGCDPRTDKESH